MLAAKRLSRSRPGNAESRAYVEIRQMIFNHSLSAGERIVPEQLARRLRLSRTPVSTALKRLVQDGLVQWIPRRGMYVCRPSRAELVLIFEIREVLEGLAARRAVSCITDEQIDELSGLFREVTEEESVQNRALYIRQDFIFHKRLLEISGSALLVDTVDSLRIMSSAFSGGLIRTVAAGMSEHERIFDALRRRSPEEAEQAMRHHLRMSTRRLVEEGEFQAAARDV